MAPFVLMAIGTGIQMFGQWAENMAQAEQEKQNQKFYQEQAKYARQSAMRAEALAEFDYTYKIGQQASAYAGGGVDSSGSAGITIGGSVKNAIDELWAIKRKGDMDTELAFARGVLSGDRAKTLSSSSYNLTQGATTLLNAYGSSEGFGQGFPDSLGPSSPTPSGRGGSLKYFP